MKMRKLAKYIHKACHEAAMECPQFSGLDDDQLVLVKGHWIEFGELPKRGVATVIRFWRDPDSIGGDILWSMGYEAKLPPDVGQLFDRVASLKGKAIKEAARDICS